MLLGGRGVGPGVHVQTRDAYGSNSIRRPNKATALDTYCHSPRGYIHTYTYNRPSERRHDREGCNQPPATRSNPKRPAHTAPTSSVQITLSPGVDIHRMRCQSHTCQASTNGRQRKQLHRETPRRYGLRGRQAAITLFREMQRAGGEGETHTYRAGPTWTEKCSIQANTRH